MRYTLHAKYVTRKRRKLLPFIFTVKDLCYPALCGFRVSEFCITPYRKGLICAVRWRLSSQPPKMPESRAGAAGKTSLLIGLGLYLSDRTRYSPGRNKPLHYGRFAQVVLEIRTRASFFPRRPIPKQRRSIANKIPTIHLKNKTTSIKRK